MPVAAQMPLEKMDQLKKALEAEGHTVKIDDRDTLRPGFKFAEWELKGCLLYTSRCV